MQTHTLYAPEMSTELYSKQSNCKTTLMFVSEFHENLGTFVPNDINSRQPKILGLYYAPRLS